MKVKHIPLYLGIAMLLMVGFLLVGCGSEPEERDPDEVWPISDLTTTELLAFYDEVLPFTDELPLPEGPVGDDDIVIGFSQTGFNHPWRVEMIKSAQGVMFFLPETV